MHVYASFSGKLTPSATQIQQTNVSYSFLISFSKTIPLNGKFVIRFPVDYNFSNVVACDFLSGFANNSLLGPLKECTYLSTTRMLTVMNAFPTTSTQIQLNVNLVTNPMYAQTTGIFQIASYYLNGTDYIMLENGGNGITMTPTTGSLLNYFLRLSNPTIGLLSVLTLQFGIQHTVPKDGSIELTLPKWNQYDPDTSQFVSMIAVSTSPGQVECLPQLGLISPQTYCLFTEGNTTDLLQIFLSESSNLIPGTLISMLIQGVRAPPSQTPIKDFTLRTLNNQKVVIDEVLNGIVLQAINPVAGSSFSASVTATPQTINSISNLTLIVQNNNPMMIGATLKITVPNDFDMTRGPVSVTASGPGLDPNPIVNYEPSTRTLTVQRFNLQYLEQLSFCYFYIYGMGNPGQTMTSSSFKLHFFDTNLKEIEYIDNGITFTAVVNGFKYVSVNATIPYINAVNVGYQFNLQPTDSFNSAAIIRLVFPNELLVSQNAYLTNVSSNMFVGAQVSVQYNQVVTISNAFPNGYKVGDLFYFTLTGVTNPPTTDKTQGITIKIYYTLKTSEINVYNGQNLTYQAQASPNITMKVNLDEMATGQLQSNLTITGTTPKGMDIAKGSFLKIQIPKQFLITDINRVAASCTAIAGFSDELLCYFQSVSDQNGAVLVVKQGFDSQSFPGGDFSFSINQIINPFTTQTTDPFGISVFDSNSKPLYIPLNNTVTSYVRASDFAFSFVKSNSNVNGASALYNFSITFSVNTPAGTYLQILLPNQITFDQTKAFKCINTYGLAPSMQCSKINDKTVSINLISNNTFANYFLNGTTIQFQIGYLINPISMKTSDSFGLQTYNIDTSPIFGQKQIYISQKLANLQITNQIWGQIKIQNISQGNAPNQLGSKTMLIFNFTTTSIIPVESILTIFLPPNLQQSSPITVVINGVDSPKFIFDVQSRKLTATVLSEPSQIFNVKVNGLVNPTVGPYQYSDFTIEFETNEGFGIDQIISQDVWVDVSCTNNCQSCSNNLNNCQMCGPDPETNITYYLSQSKCVSQCPKGQFGGPQYQCLNCSSPCIDCVYAPDLCTICDPKSSKPYSNLVTLSCYSQCPSSTYADNEKMQCLPCQSPCYTCKSATECLTCDSTNSSNVDIFYFNDTCDQKCPLVSVPSPSNICVDCEAPCLTCQNLPDKCTSCSGGLYLYKNLCLSDCPWQYYKDDDLMQCKSVAELAIPFPFSITIITISIGVAISGCMKHGGKGSTSFFVTCLAFCDMLLRINWLTVLIVAVSKQYLYTFYGCCGLLGINLVINLGIWRRLFKYKYNMDENDKAFSSYCQTYKFTSTWILFFSYLLSFQAVRLTYSKFLGKKMFMAQFTRQRRYYRLIGQLSLIEIFCLFLPAIALMVYSLIFFFIPGDQMFYLCIDSLFLVAYATFLITGTLLQREQDLKTKELFNWSEICRCCIESDEEKMYEQDPEETLSVEKPVKKNNKVFATVESDDYFESQRQLQPDEIELEAMSAADFNQVKKQKLYQTEHRVEIPKKLEKDEFIDYNEYHNLEEKLNRIRLKQRLYENIRISDYEKVQKLSGSIHTEIQDKDELKKQILKLQQDLNRIQSHIEDEVKHLDQDVSEVIKKKRLEIAKRSVQSVQDKEGFTLNSVQSPHQNLFNFGDLKPRGTDAKVSGESGYHNSNGPSARTLSKQKQLQSSSSKNSKQSVHTSLRNKTEIYRDSFGPNNNNF